MKFYESNIKTFEMNKHYYYLQAIDSIYCLIIAQLIVSAVLLDVTIVILWKEEAVGLTEDSLSTHKHI